MKRLLVILIVLTIASLSLALSPEEIINKVNSNFSKIRDGEGDITLDTRLFVVGCSGLQRSCGHFWFQAPDRLKIALDGTTYFAQGNDIRKIDADGKHFYVRLLNAPDLAPGFNPDLITYNFNLKITGTSTGEVVLEGTPKPGVLKNAKKVIFYVDTDRYLLKRLYVVFDNKRLSGAIDIDYQLINNIWVPVGFHGKTALELTTNILAGLGMTLNSSNVRINLGLPDRLFEAGF